MRGPIGEKDGDEYAGGQFDIREEIRAIIKKQKEEEKERRKALEEQIKAIVETQKAAESERKKALDGQIKALLEKQKEEEREHKKSAREEIAARMTVARGLAREDHLRRCLPDGLKQPEFMRDQGDADVLRKGFLKLHILGVLKEGPSHGYEIMHSIGHHTGHLWKPSPGSMYPALESLEAKGFIACQGDGRRKVYSLTPKGEEAIGQVQKKREEQFLEMKVFLADIFGE